MSCKLVVSFSIDGTHYWPDAPKKYSEFSHPHRHLFKFILWFAVKDSDDPTTREVELWDLRYKAKTAVYSMWALNRHKVNFGSMSCEGISKALKEKMGADSVFVGEEENLGALVQ